MTTWWNTSYSIRRNLKIDRTNDEEVIVGNPIYVLLDATTFFSSNKMRVDFEDLEVLYYDSTISTPSWTLLGREIQYDSETGIITVIFNALGYIKDIDQNYYIYYCNPSLKNQSDRPTYISSIYNTVATPTNGRIMFTRPTEDWQGGISNTVNARAAFTFWGKHAKVIFKTRTDGGLVEIKSSLGTVFNDTYSNGEEDLSLVLEFPSVSKNTIRIRTTGDKNPTSNGFLVELKQIEFSQYVESTPLSEDIFSSSEAIRTLIGS